jgi:hypothetical protein
MTDPSPTPYSPLVQIPLETIRVLSTAKQFRAEQVRCRLAIRAKAKSQRDEMKAIKRQAWQTVLTFKKVNRLLSANLCRAIIDSDIAVAATNDQTLGSPNPTYDTRVLDQPLTYVCQHCGESFQALPPRSGVRRFCNDACKQAAYRDRASKRNEERNEERTILSVTEKERT